ncbi:hypothetical protein GORHZ_060_00500, partial [Gordonia rhizosphera NBRC 16068]
IQFGVGPVLFVLFIVEIIAIVIAYRWTVGRERGWLRDMLAPEVDAGVITPEELNALAGSRRQRRKYIKSKDNNLTKKQAKSVFVATTDLAEAIAKSGATETEDVGFARSEIARVRTI